MAVDFGTGQGHDTVVSAVIDLRGSTAEAAEEVEQIHVEVDSAQWKMAHHYFSQRDDNLELTRNGEQIQQWTELFSKQRFPLISKTKATVDGMVKAMHNSLKATDPNVEFNVISQSPSEVHYHWVSHPTEGNPAQHEVAKIIKGQKDFYRIAYVKKTDRLSETELAKWNRVIGDAKLVPLSPEADQTIEKTKETPAAQISTTSNSKFQAWGLGKSLSFAALIRGKHGPDDVVKSTLMKVSENAQALNVSVPAPSKLTDDASADTAAAIQFLLETAGKPLYNSLQKSHGDEHAALFELATKSSLLMMLYQPGDSTSTSFASAIERAAKKAKLETEVWKPLTDKIQNEEPQAKVSAEIRDFQARVAKAIE